MVADNEARLVLTDGLGFTIVGQHAGATVVLSLGRRLAGSTSSYRKAVYVSTNT